MKRFDGFLSHLSLALGGLALTAAAALPAQQAPVHPGEPQSFTVLPGTPQDEGATPMLHSVTRRVVVDVVVTGPDGKPVSGLTQKDFTVYEDRKPQSVRAFEVHTPQADTSLLPPAPPQLPGHTFVNLERTPASGPPVVVLLDDLNTPVTDQAYAHEQIVQFLEHKPASTEVAIFALADNLSLVQGFTTDTARLLAAMRSKAAGLRMPTADSGDMKAEITLDAFEELGKFLATLDGRKNLLWFSESFQTMVLPEASNAEGDPMSVANATGNPNTVQSRQGNPSTMESGPGSPNSILGPSVTTSALHSPMIGGSDSSLSGDSYKYGDLTVLRAQLRKVAIALAVSQTAVYPIDVRGLLSSGPEMTAEAVSPNVLGLPSTMPVAPTTGPQALDVHDQFMQSLEATQATMQEIAQATGGKAYVNTNELALAADKAVHDGSDYYTLVYAPSNMNFDGGLRSIHVALDRPGCHLAYRSAYYAVDSSSVTPDAIQSGSLAAAMVHGGPEAQGLLFKAQIDPDGPPEMAPPDSPLAVSAALNEHKRRKKQELSGMVQPYEIRLAILAQQLQFTQTPDGRRHAALQIAVYAYAADGRKLGGTRQNLEASLPPAVYTYDLYSGMFHNLRVLLPVEAASLRLAILDPGNRRTGSLEVPLPLAPVQQAVAPPPAGAAAR